MFLLVVGIIEVIAAIIALTVLSNLRDDTPWGVRALLSGIVVVETLLAVMTFSMVLDTL